MPTVRRKMLRKPLSVSPELPCRRRKGTAMIPTNLEYSNDILIKMMWHDSLITIIT